MWRKRADFRNSRRDENGLRVAGTIFGMRRSRRIDWGGIARRTGHRGITVARALGIAPSSSVACGNARVGAILRTDGDGVPR